MFRQGQTSDGARRKVPAKWNGQGRHRLREACGATGKGAQQSHQDRSSCRKIQEVGRFSICLLCPCEYEFGQNLDRSPEECAGTTHLKYGIRAHLTGSVFRVTSSFPEPSYGAIRTKGEINPERACVWSLMSEAKAISLDVNQTQL